MAVSLFLICVLLVVCDAAIISIVDIQPGMVPPYNTTTYLGGYSRVTFRYQTTYGGPTTYPQQYQVECWMWIHAADGNDSAHDGQVAIWGKQTVKLTTTSGQLDASYPEDFLNAPVATSDAPFYSATPGLNISMQLQCRYIKAAEGALCISNSDPPANTTLCLVSPKFYFLWGATPNIPPLNVVLLNSSFISVSWVHDAVVQGYANQYYELQQCYDPLFNASWNTTIILADRYDVAANQTKIQNMTAGYVYYWRMRAWNGIKYSTYSTIFKTIAEDTPVTPTNVQATVASSNSIYITWNETTVPGQFPNRQFQCATVQLGGSIRYSSNNPYFYVGLTNELSLGLTYYCSVRLENDNGTSSWASAPPLLLAVKPDPPTNLVPAVDTATSAKLTWTPGSNNGAQITDSYVEYMDVGGAPNSWTGIFVGNAVPSYTLNNLQSHHLYWIRVSSQNSKGTGNPVTLSSPYLIEGAPNITSITVATPSDDNDPGANILVPDTLGSQSIIINGGGFDVFGAPTVAYGPSGNHTKFVCTVTASTSIQITCNLEAGVGKDLAFVVSSGSQSSASSDTISNPVTLSYPPPSIDDNSTHRPPDTLPYDDPLPAESSASELIIFNGKNFGPNNGKNPLTVTYGPSSNRTKYTCQVVAFTPTQVTCLTAPAPAVAPTQLRDLTFQVTAGSQLSPPGTDVYNYPVSPVITNITGCPRVCNLSLTNYVGACDCPTRGHIPLTITGQYLTKPLAITIRGVPCDIVNGSWSNSATQVQCTLSDGTGGLSLDVVAVQSSFTSAATDASVSYATPTILTASGCPTTGCLRTGGDSLIITGYNFGPGNGTKHADAFVGGIKCTSTVHSTVLGLEHEQLTCTVPPGAGNASVISVLQYEGALGVNNSVSIKYEPCPAGTEPLGFNGCQDCKAGKYTSGPGLPQCVNCSAGSYNDSDHATMCTPCVKGKYTSGLTPNQCIDCDKGKYTASDNQAACIECEVGTVKGSPSSADCDICPIGKYQDTKGQYECQGCTPGKYADTNKTITCKECEPGKASNNTNETMCTACLAGEYQSLQGQTECLKCPAGLFSPVNSSVCLNCSAGFYSPQNGSSGCMACPDGFYQSNAGQDHCLPCRVGEYKTYDFYRGSVSCLVCPAGSYSNKTNSSSCDLCTAGTYQDSSNKTNCSLCDYGQYQPLDGKIDCLECDSGYYGNTQGRSQCLLPPGGFFAVKRFNGTRGAVNYSACAPGFTSSSDHTGCTLCPGGRFNPYYGDVCALCIPGRFTIDTTDVENPNINCTVCGAGKYAPVNGSTRCYDCAKGLFSQTESQQCDKCPGGSIVDDTQAKCLNCSTGQYAPEGALNCSDCPIGKFSSHGGAAVCTDCTSGSASDLIGAIKCDVCGEGSSSRPGASECVKCDLGTYAPQNGTTTCFQCGPGTFVNNTGQTGCIDCDPGSYSAENSSKVCTLCTSGYYTGVKKSTYCIKCPARTFSGGSGNTICATCGKGYVVNRDATGCLDDYWQEQEVVGFYSFLGAAGLGTIVLTVFSLIYLRENRLIYYSSPPFMYTILAGMSLVWASVILIIVNQQPWICHLKYVFLNIGVAIVLMCVTTKTWRLHRIFNRNKQDALKTVVIKDSTLFVWVFAFVGWDILVLAVWWGVAMFSVDDLVHKCITLWEPWVHIALWFWKPLVILYLIYLCIKVRSIDERFNESWWIGIGIYNVVVVLILFLILTLTLPLRPREWFIMFDTVIAYLIGTSWALIFLPKYYQIYKKKHENEELFGAEIASDITEAEEVAEEEKHDEATDEAEKKKGISVDKGDDALTKLHIKREKKAKELNKLLKIVDRTKQRMKTDITNLNHLSSDVLALHQEIEYRKKLLNKKGVVVSNKPKDKQDLEMTQQQQSTVNLHADAGSSDAYASPTPSKPGTELEPADEQPHLEPSSYNNYEA